MPFHWKDLWLQRVSKIRVTLDYHVSAVGAAVTVRVINEVLAHEQDGQDLLRLATTLSKIGVPTYLKAYTNQNARNV
jgi:hypothetical protein